MWHSDYDLTGTFSNILAIRKDFPGLKVSAVHLSLCYLFLKDSDLKGKREIDLRAKSEKEGGRRKRTMKVTVNRRTKVRIWLLPSQCNVYVERRHPFYSLFPPHPTSHIPSHITQMVGGSKLKPVPQQLTLPSKLEFCFSLPTKYSSWNINIHPRFR